jgi:DNA primase|tara:strand:+ start:532 stop:2340 length:1809 start_codon:yes stop_codon:yes gene_type:complete
MSMKYPKEYLDEIKLRLKVSQVVGKSVQLKKRGKEFIGLSPFKNEKSPSFTVSDEKEFYHCFSTGEHGNIFDFLMKTKSMGFGEAVKVLASEAGMQPYRFSNFDEKKEKKFTTYKNIYKKYSEFFYRQLFANSNDSNLALEYLSKRKLSRDIIEEFRLGYVPWKNSFYDELIKDYSEEEINSTGLYYKNDKTGKYVDRFNSRIIFPVNNLTGDTIAFGGRIIKESKLAKYINSPETDFYKKGRVIFNLDKAKSLRAQTNEVIIVEGYMDVVSLHASGIKNVVANSGTALTENQIDLIWKFFSDPTVCLDGDISGQKAALRIAEKLIPIINEGNKIFFSVLPAGEDPDDFIKKNGKENFKNFLEGKKIIQNFIWDEYIKDIRRSDPFAISKFEKKIKNICYTIKDEILKKYILEEFLEKIKDLTPILNTKKNIKNFNSFNNFRKKDFRILNETKILHNQQDGFTKEKLKEYSILFIMLNHTDAAQSKIEELSEINFSTEDCNDLKNLILKYYSDEVDSSNIKAKATDQFKNLIKSIEKNSNLKNIINKKDHNQKVEILNEQLEDLRQMNQLKKIELLEGKLAKNLDEASFSELIKLKSQLNKD